MGRKRVPVNVGDRFGRLTITSVFPRIVNGKRHHTAVMADCDCGSAGREYMGSHLVSGDTQSCGCRQRELTSAANSTHHASKTPLYRLWLGVIHRCTNPTARTFNRYGGRGITVCDEWRGDFLAFREWSMANGYIRGLSLDRIDNDGPYHPDNCRWTTNKVQSSNRRTNVWVDAFGERKTMTQWSEDPRCAVKLATLRMRLRSGRDPEEAISAPAARRQAMAPGYDRLYNIWQGIKQRCYNPTSSVWRNYGARGIVMCDEWRERSAPFKAWALENGYADDLSLDRIDPNGNYEPGNVRWVTRSVQNNNKRTTVFITAFGETKGAADWARDERCGGASRGLLRNRITDGWDPERAIVTPSRCRPLPAG